MSFGRIYFRLLPSPDRKELNSLDLGSTAVSKHGQCIVNFEPVTKTSLVLTVNYDSPSLDDALEDLLQYGCYAELCGLDYTEDNAPELSYEIEVPSIVSKDEVLDAIKNFDLDSKYVSSRQISESDTVYTFKTSDPLCFKYLLSYGVPFHGGFFPVTSKDNIPSVDVPEIVDIPPNDVLSPSNFTHDTGISADVLSDCTSQDKYKPKRSNKGIPQQSTKETFESKRLNPGRMQDFSSESDISDICGKPRKSTRSNHDEKSGPKIEFTSGNKFKSRNSKRHYSNLDSLRFSKHDMCRHTIRRCCLFPHYTTTRVYSMKDPNDAYGKYTHTSCGSHHHCSCSSRKATPLHRHNDEVRFSYPYVRKSTLPRTFVSDSTGNICFPSPKVSVSISAHFPTLTLGCCGKHQFPQYSLKRETRSLKTKRKCSSK